MLADGPDGDLEKKGPFPDLPRSKGAGDEEEQVRLQTGILQGPPGGGGGCSDVREVQGDAGSGPAVRGDGGEVREEQRGAGGGPAATQGREVLQVPAESCTSGRAASHAEGLSRCGGDRLRDVNEEFEVASNTVPFLP